MRIDLYLIPFLTAFALTIGLSVLFLSVPFLRERPWRNRTHGGRSLSRMGGAAMILAFLIALFTDTNLVLTKEFLGLSVGAIVVLAFGLWDDFSELDWKTQVFFQAALAILIFIFGIRVAYVTNPMGGIWSLHVEDWLFPSFLFVFCWIVLVMNVTNWLDGLDGLCGGVSFITFLTIFALSLKPEVNQPPIAILAIIGAGVTAGFLLFNIYPARILAGTAGSMFLGFFIAVLAIVAGTKIATALLVLALPIADAVWVVISRFRAKVPIFEADQRHLHYKLRELGWSDGHITAFFFLVTALIGWIALNTQALGKLAAILLVLGVIFSLLLFVERKTVLKSA